MSYPTSSADSASADGALRVLVQLRLDDTLRLQLRGQLTSADPLPARCSFKASVTFGQVHAYVRQQLIAVLVRDLGRAGTDGQPSLPITYLDVSTGGAEVVPAPETSLASILYAVGQNPAGTGGCAGPPTLMTINVRSQVFSG